MIKEMYAAPGYESTSWPRFNFCLIFHAIVFFSHSVRFPNEFPGYLCRHTLTFRA